MKIILRNRSKKEIEVEDLVDAKMQTLKARGAQKAHSFAGAYVFNDEGKQIAVISYNGRIWKDESLQSEEIILH